jgi:CBS domain-containing protein
MFLKVEYLMTRDVVTVELGSPLKTAVDLMNEHDIGCVVVLENGKPIGIITERDLMKKVFAVYEEAKQLKVDQVMSKPIIAARKDEDGEHAAKKMLEKRIKKLPVIDDGTLVGIVTLTDLFKYEPELIKSYTTLMRCKSECPTAQSAVIIQTPKE